MGSPKTPVARTPTRCALIAGLVAAFVYFSTLIREVDWGDPAELALQAFQLGVTHSTGYVLHTFFGHLAGLLVPDAALATNYLSAVSASIAAALLAATVFTLVRSEYAAACAGLVFALTPRVWGLAVNTTSKTLNVCLLALAFLLLASRPEGRPSKRFWAAAVVFGLSLGSYLANVLLLPGMLVLLLRQRVKIIHVAVFFLVIALVGGSVLSWSFFRSSTIAPLGTAVVPSTPTNFVLFLAGVQHGTIEAHPPAFYRDRLLEHGYTFTRNLVGLGVLLGLLGIWSMSRLRPDWCVALLVAFAADMGFFTFYRAHDYHLMVTPAYWIFSLWIGYGIAFLLQEFRGTRWQNLAALAPLIIVALLLAAQVRLRYERSRSTEVTDFANSAFSVLPQQAVALTRWREFTPLLYFQKTRGLRTDVTVVQCAKHPTYLDFEKIESCSRFLESALPARNVYINEGTLGVFRNSLGPRYHFLPLNEQWYKIELVAEKAGSPESMTPRNDPSN